MNNGNIGLYNIAPHCILCGEALTSIGRLKTADDDDNEIKYGQKRKIRQSEERTNQVELKKCPSDIGFSNKN